MQGSRKLAYCEDVKWRACLPVPLLSLPGKLKLTKEQTFEAE